MESQEQRPLLVSFVASTMGSWRFDRINPVVGETLPFAERLEIVESPSVSSLPEPSWVLRGITSNVRYTNRSEVDALSGRQEPLDRPQATRAALIPIRKTAAWWDLAQDERRRIFEEESQHIAIGLQYLPAVARRLHHSRELGEPFDFLTWFEYAPEYSDAFEQLVVRLRNTKEWKYVDREIDIRLIRS
jgi:chlorite dismutase